jgi:hypothetical protein
VNKGVSIVTLYFMYLLVLLMLDWWPEIDQCWFPALLLPLKKKTFYADLPNTRPPNLRIHYMLTTHTH